MATPSPENEIERLSALIGQDDPLVRNILISASRNPWFADSALGLLYEYARKLGLDPSRTEPFYKRIDPNEVLGDIKIGREKFHGFITGLYKDDLSASMILAGQPGVLKTNTFEVICPQWVGLGNSFFAISQKRDFLGLVDVVPDCCVMDVLEDFRFNVLRTSSPEGANRHAQTIANVARKNFESMLSGEIHLYEIVDRLYQKFGIYDGEMEEFPTMSDVLEYVENQYVRPHTEEARAQERLIMRLGLLNRALGETINVSRGILIEELLENNIILLVDRLTPQVRDFLIEAVMVAIFEHQIEKGERV